MIKIPLMTSGPCREGSAPSGHGDRLEPTQPLAARETCPTALIVPPILRPWF